VPAAAGCGGSCAALRIGPLALSLVAAAAPAAPFSTPIAAQTSHFRCAAGAAVRFGVRPRFGVGSAAAAYRLVPRRGHDMHGCGKPCAFNSLRSREAAAAVC